MKLYLQLTPLVLLHLSLVKCAISTDVLELSDRFLEVKHQDTWLVMFYAPWCGHCKRLDPVWQQVAQVLVDTDIHVSRVDCTRFTSVATEFSVRGFPTILFIKGSTTVEYKGDRTKEDISEFARRMDGPTVGIIEDCMQLDPLRQSKPVFFVFFEADYNAKTEEDKILKDEYQEVAREHQQYHYFFSTYGRCLYTMGGVSVKAPTKATVSVFKDKITYLFNNSTEKLGGRPNMTLSNWVNEERFQTFLKITNGNFYQLLKTGKHLVIAVLEENQIRQLSLKMREFHDVLEAIALSNQPLYRRHFVFGWLPNPELANMVAMSTLPVPSLIVVNTETYQYYLPELPAEQTTPAPQDIIQLLGKIMDDTAIAYGGDTWPYKLYRTYYEARVTLSSMWKGNPVLMCVIFGLPLGFLSIICYTSCCQDIMEAPEEDETENDEGGSHEKKD